MKNLDYLDDFTEDLDNLSGAIDLENTEREADDAEILDLVNNVC